ncbi:unnamed protein product, partial [Phaeothamnion confervicola]
MQPPFTVVQLLCSCDSVAALVWASSAGWMTVLALVLAQRLLDLGEAMATWMAGMKEVLEAQFVLVLAWALGQVVLEVGTATYLAGALEAGVPPSLLPALVAVMCCAISFATGSTFGTMGIVFPLVGPLAWRLGGGSVPYMDHCLGCVLGASIFGNVCSPISDTVILTSSATGEG